MPKDNRDKNRDAFILAQGTGNLDEGENEPIMMPWTDSISTKPTEYTLEKKAKQAMTKEQYDQKIR